MRFLWVLGVLGQLGQYKVIDNLYLLIYDLCFIQLSGDTQMKAFVIARYYEDNRKLLSSRIIGKNKEGYLFSQAGWEDDFRFAEKFRERTTAEEVLELIGPQGFSKLSIQEVEI